MMNPSFNGGQIESLRTFFKEDSQLYPSLSYPEARHSAPPAIFSGERIVLPTVSTSRMGVSPFGSLIPKVKFGEECLNILSEIGPTFLKEEPEALQEIFEEYSRLWSEKRIPLHGQIAQMSVRLYLYSQLKPGNGFHFRALDYLKYSLMYGPAFAELLKSVRQAAMIKTLSTRLTRKNLESFEDIINNDLKIDINLDQEWDYDSFLNERYLIDFTEEGSDLPWAFEPLDIDARSLIDFRDAAACMLKDYKIPEIHVPTSVEYGSWISDSITQTDDGPRVNRSLLRDLARSGDMEELTAITPEKPMRFRRVLVPVGPANLRDTWQCYPDTLFAVKRISFLLRQVLDNLPHSAMALPYKAIQRRKILKQENATYLMFDYKKCGLTVNRQLITILGEELEYLYPGKGFEEIRRFSNVQLENLEATLFPPRGVGLGNCNEGVTLIQCVVGYMFKKIAGIDSVFFNDDGVFVLTEQIFRRFTQIGTMLKNLGLILNLKKTLLSDCNIFCEDYIVSDRKTVDFSKSQLSILPYAACFFQPNIAAAKSLFYSLERGNIGRQIDASNLLSSLVQRYGIEFHESEICWPFELGGWAYFGRTSVNEVLEFVFHPQRFLTTDRERGSIPFIAEWVHYLVSHNELTKLLRLKGRIPFRGFVENPFKDSSLRAPQSDDVVEILKLLGLSSNQEIKEERDSLYNFRGLKNAKPHIKIGLINQRLYARRSIWRSFKAFRVNNRKTFWRTWHDVMTVLNFMKGGDTLPSYYLPPSFLIEGWLDPCRARKRGRYLIPKPKKTLGSRSREGFNALLESSFQGQWRAGSDYYAAYDYFIASRDRSIISNIDLYVPEEEYAPPDYVYLFLPSKRYAIILLYSIYKKIPTKWRSYTSPALLFSRAINPLEKIFPSHARAWRKIRMRYEKIGASQEFREILKSIDILSEDESKLVLQMLHDEYHILAEEKESDRLLKRGSIDHETSELLIHFEENESLAGELLGARDEADLVSDFENEFDEYEYYPSDNDLPEDFLPPEDDVLPPDFLGEEYEYDEFSELDRISVCSAVSSLRSD